MAAYNKVNGTYCSENDYLLNEMLKEEFGFDGLVMSDWGAYHSATAYARGFDLNTPGGEGGWFGGSPDDLKDAITEGTITESDLDRAIATILKVVVKTEAFKNQTYDKSEFVTKTDLSDELKEVGVELSKRAALEGIVLLKNEDNTLPLSEGGITVGVTGENAVPEVVEASGWTAPTKGIIFEGGGSACVNVDIDDVVSLVQGLENGGLEILQTNEDGDYLVEGLSMADAVYAAANSDIGIVSIGKPGSEGSDNITIDLDDDEIDLIRKLSTAYHNAGKKLIVILNVACPVACGDWEEYADAILYVGLPGTYGANAIADILTGEANPSGKLVDSWPVEYEDLSNAGIMPTSSTTEIKYEEGIYVGYRHFDTEGTAPMYPFGHGLSYTTFEYSNIQLSSDTFDLSSDTETLTVTAAVYNSGNVAGREVVQLYIRDDDSTVDRPYKELKGFMKTKLLAPGETEIVTFTINKRDLSYFDEKDPAVENDGEWVAEPGTFTIFIGGTSDTAILNTEGKGVKIRFTAY